MEIGLGINSSADLSETTHQDNMYNQSLDKAVAIILLTVASGPVCWEVFSVGKTLYLGINVQSTGGRV